MRRPTPLYPLTILIVLLILATAPLARSETGRALALCDKALAECLTERDYLTKEIEQGHEKLEEALTKQIEVQAADTRPRSFWCPAGAFTAGAASTAAILGTGMDGSARAGLLAGGLATGLFVCLLEGGL